MRVDFLEITLGSDEIYRDITGDVQKIIDAWNLRSGHILVFTKHTTCGLLVQEDEGGLALDLLWVMDQMAPRSAPGGLEVKRNPQYYVHDDLARRTHIRTDGPERTNGDAHVSSSFLLKTQETFLVLGGELDLGQWQSILFFDRDFGGKRVQRTISVSLINGDFKSRVPYEESSAP